MEPVPATQHGSCVKWRSFDSDALPHMNGYSSFSESQAQGTGLCMFEKYGLLRAAWYQTCFSIERQLMEKKSPPLGLCVGVWTHIFIYFTNEHIWSLLCSAFFTTSRTLPHKQNMQIFNTAHLHLAVPSHNSLQQALQQLHQLSVSLLSLNISHRTSLPHGGPWRLPLESLLHCRSDQQF